VVYRRWWFVVGVVLISLGVTGLAGAQLPVPVPTPPVQTPPLPTPPLPKPPAVPVPTPPAPKPPALPTTPPVPTVPVPTPPAPVRTPSVSVPSVSTPAISTPAGSVPSVSTPKVSIPASSGRAGAGSSTSGSARAAGSAAIGAAGAATGPTGTTPGGSTGSDAGPTGAGGQSTSGRSSKGATDNSAAKVRRRDRALRRAVLRFQGCLSRVPRAERRVLMLRAGVGTAKTHSRTEVARITHLRRARVITLERRGLRRLHALGRAGACQDTQATSATATAGDGGALPPGSTPSGRGAVLAEHHSSDGKSGGSQGHAKPSAELSISRPLRIPGEGGGSFDLALVLAPLAVFTFVLVTMREVRRDRRPGT
jgi:hypothetical protein